MTNPVLSALYSGLGFLEQQRAQRRRDELLAQEQKYRASQASKEDFSTINQLEQVGQLTNAQGDVSIMDQVQPELRGLLPQSAEMRMADPSRMAAVTLNSGQQVGVERYTPLQLMARERQAKQIAASDAFVQSLRMKAAEAALARQENEKKDAAYLQLHGIPVQRPTGEYTSENVQTEMGFLPQPVEQTETKLMLPAEAKTIEDIAASRQKREQDAQMRQSGGGLVQLSGQIFPADKKYDAARMRLQAGVTQFIRAGNFDAAQKLVEGAYKEVNDREQALDPDIQKSKQALRINVGVPGQSSEDPKDVAQGIIDGILPPETTGLYRAGLPVKAILARSGYNLSKANTDWKAVQRHLATLNGPQQERLRQAINFTYDSIDMIEGLYNEWRKVGTASGVKLFNRAALSVSKSLPGKAGEIATNMEAQINDLVSELGTVYKGGNSSTDESLRLAAENLKAEWNPQTFERALKQIRENLRIRRNSINQSMPQGVSENSPYLQGRGAGEAAKTADPLGIR
jgi:hypothetical protein